MNVIQDKEFMQHFWDLAVDDADVRRAAAAKVTANDIPSNYKSYTLKRLVKGLTSPRDSARLGFATALTQFLVNHQVDPQEVLTLLDEHTKVSGALKGFEERDNLFGKLFGFAALIRSGIVKDNELAVLELFKRLIDLHQRKAWMQELAVENLLSLLSSTKKSIQLKIAPKLAELCASPLEEMSENELFLRIGLQSFAAQSKDVASVIYTTLSTENDFSMDSLPAVKQALFRSAHKFPKVHRLWDYILGSVFAFGEDRELVSKSSLTDAEIAHVKTLVEFLSNEMFPFSKEKRALGMKLCLKLLYLVPAYCLPNVFTEKFVRSLYIARVNARSTLFEFAGGILSEVEVYAGDNQQRILAILTLMAEYGYINFDKAANVKFVQHLMTKMDGESLTEFMKILCANIGDSNDAVVVNDNDEEDEDNGEDIAENLLRRNRGVAAIFLFSEMGKFVRPALRSQQTPIMMSILTRLACFSSGETRKWSATAAAAAAKKDKKAAKGGKKDKTAAAAAAVEVTPEMLVMDECIALLESTESVKVQGPSTEIQEQATVALLSLIHDTKSHLLFAPKPTTATGGGDAAAVVVDAQQKKAATQAEVRIFTLWSKAFAHFVASGLSNKHVDSERLTPASLQELSQGVASVLQWLDQHLEDDGGKETEQYKTENFLMALLSVIVLASIHALTCEEVDADIVTRTSGAALRLLLQLQKEAAETAAAAAAGAKKSNKKDEEKEEEDDEEEDPQLDLLDCSVEFLSVSSDHAIKGLRDAIKRMWSAIFALIPEESLSQTVMDVLVDVVMGNSNDHDDAAAGDDDDEDDEDAEEEEEEAEEEDDEEVEEAAASKSKKTAAASAAAGKKQPPASKKSTATTAADEDEKKDVMIQNDDFMDFMMVDDGAFVDHVIEKKMTMDTDDDGDNDEDDGDEGAMVHRREADGALGNLIRMRKESRKEGLMALHRKQILLRSRVLDILEALINRVRSGPTLFSLLQPMVLGAKKSIKSKIMADINEGKTLLARILSLLAQLCKKKMVIHVAASADDGLEEEFVAELNEFRPVLHTMMLSKVLQIRQVAQDMIITLVRIAWASDSAAAQTIVAGIVEALWEHFATKRHSTIPGKYLEDVLVQRFPTVFLPRFLPRLLQALVETPLLYTKGEISEMLLSILKRFANLETTAKDAMAAQVGPTIEAFAKVFASLAQTAATATAPSSSSASKKTEQSFSTKRVKPLIASVKSLVELLIRSNQKSTETSTATAEQTKKLQQRAQAEATTEKLFASVRVAQVQALRDALAALSAALTSTLGKPLEELIALTQSLEDTVRSKVKVVEPPVAPTTPASKKAATAKKSDKKAAPSSSTAMDEDEKVTADHDVAATKSAAKKKESKKRKASDVDEDDAAAAAEAAEAAAAAAVKTPASSKKNKKSKSS